MSQGPLGDLTGTNDPCGEMVAVGKNLQWPPLLD
jgi:hypothetical protein